MLMMTSCDFFPVKITRRKSWLFAVSFVM